MSDGSIEREERQLAAQSAAKARAAADELARRVAALEQLLAATQARCDSLAHYCESAHKRITELEARQ